MRVELIIETPIMRYNSAPQTTASKITIKLNQYLFKTKTEHITLMKVGFTHVSHFTVTHNSVDGGVWLNIQTGP